MTKIAKLPQHEPYEEFAIEKGVPIPLPKKAGKYPWRTMEVGDSFFVANVGHKDFATNASQARKRTGFKFTLRKVEGGVRIWRIE
jgi:hypothetical protein